MKDTAIKQINTVEHKLGDELYVNHYLVNGANPLGIQAFYHTYPVVMDGEGKRYAWGALGGHDGGSLLDGSKTYGKAKIDIETIDYIMTKAPCIWEMDYYAVVGVCWNATNRALYFTHKTVHNVKFYSVVEFWFGTYGLDDDSTCFTKKSKKGKELYGWSKARKSISDNCPWLGNVDSELRMTQSNNSRIVLYHKYYGEQMGKKTDENRWLSYLQDLVRLNMKEKIRDLDEDKLIKALSIHKNMHNPRLTMGISNNNKIESHFNNVLEEFKKLLSDIEYNQLFNAQKDEIFKIV